MKKAFTMIELVFVIMIIGILAAVALPKISANRDDAMAIVCVKTAQQFVNDLALYYSVYGNFSTVSDMSNVAINNTEFGFSSDTDFKLQSVAQLYCDGVALVEYNTTKNSVTEIGMKSLSPTSTPAAFIADKMLTENGFYRSYLLGGYR